MNDAYAASTPDDGTVEPLSALDRRSSEFGTSGAEKSDAARQPSANRKRRKPRRAVEIGVSDEEYARRLEAQDGGCAICGNPPKTRRLHVDHNHRTGRVRGLLCFRCNRALPTYATSDWLERARVYVHADEWGMGGDIPDQWIEAR